MSRASVDRSGVLGVDKPAVPSSHDVVVAARRQGLARRVGHAGTLDPFATGVLPILFGVATRLSRFLTGSTKTYEATVQFGAETTTGDPHGERADTGPVPAEDALRAALHGLTGRLMQVPPAFSAKSVDGVRAYKRARSGDLTELPPVEALVLLDISFWNGTGLRQRSALHRVAPHARRPVRARGCHHAGRDA